jgi:four helix bundle suffix protein
MDKKERLIPKHGGYRKLKTFQIAQLIYDMTVRFCELYIHPRSRTSDQMIQAARSGAQNIAEGSQASGTSKKTEIKLTSVGRASLEELRLDYEDYLRQRNLPMLEPDDPILKRFKARRCSTLDQVRNWIAYERSHGQKATTKQTEKVSVRESPCRSLSTDALAANGTLSLINLCCYMLDCQIEKQAKMFEKEGGFTERLYKIRTSSRKANRYRNATVDF